MNKPRISLLESEDANATLFLSDGIRRDLLQAFFDSVKEDEEYNIEDPDYSDLLNPHDGYEHQTYIQNNIENDEVIYWEGFSDYCWKAFKQKYPNKSKTQIIETFVNLRAKDYGTPFGYKLGDYDYFVAEDVYDNYQDYILKLIFIKDVKVF